MREPPLCTAEKQFLLQSFLENYRVDGRAADDYRVLDIQLGAQPGQCLTQLGNTKVFSQVSCELKEPKETRPSDGTLFVNVLMSNMAAPQYELGRTSDTGIELCRLLERTVKESGCVDTESLCVKSGALAWQVRLDIHVLDDDGSLVDCASVAAVTALAHFTRPDCTVSKDTVVVHPPSEKAPVPLNLYHYPVCMTFGFSENGACVIVDPCDKERQVLDGCVVVGANKRKEICALHVTGSLTLSRDQMLTVCSRAIQRSAYVSERIQTAINEQRQAKMRKEAIGLTCSYFTQSERMPGSEPSTSCVVPQTQTQLQDTQHNTRLSSQGSVARLSEASTAAAASGTVTSSLLRSESRPDVAAVPSDDDDDEVMLIEQELGRAQLHSQSKQGKRSSEEPIDDLRADANAGSSPAKKPAKQPKQTIAAGTDLDELFGDIEQDVRTLDSEFKSTKSTQNAVVDATNANDDLDLSSALKPKKKRKSVASRLQK